MPNKVCKGSALPAGTNLKAIGKGLLRITLSTAILFVGIITTYAVATDEVTSAEDSPPGAAGVWALGPGECVNKTIEAGGSQTFEINLSEGQYVRLAIDKKDLSLGVKISAAGGGQPVELPSRCYEELEIHYVSDSTGPYHLKVQSLEKGAGSRPYQIRFLDAMQATEKSRRAFEAFKAFAQAEMLRSTWAETTLRQSIEQYMHTSELWLFAGNGIQAARSKICAGDVHFILSQYQEAMSAFSQALKISQGINHLEGIATALNRISYVYISLGENRKALNLINQVLSFYNRPDAAGNTIQGQEAQAWNNKGEVYYALSDVPKALDCFNKARQLWAKAEDRKNEALAAINIGYAYYDSGDLQNASEHYRTALLLWQAVDDRRGEALAQTALGAVYSYWGETQSALSLHDRAMTLFRQIGDHQGEAAALNGLAMLYAEMNERQVALDKYSQALKLYQAIGNRNYVALTTYYVGTVFHSMGKLDQALANYQGSIDLSRKVGDRRIEAYALKGIGRVYSDLNQKQKALEQYRVVLKLYRELEDRRGEAYAQGNIGQVFYSVGEFHRALEYYQQALSLVRAAQDRSGEIGLLYDLALTEHALGDYDTALSLIKTSINLIESFRTRVVIQDLRVSYFASVHQHYELCINLLMHLDKRHPGQGFAAEALLVSERARARSLLDTLIMGMVNIRQGIDPSLAEREDSLQQMLDAKMTTLMRSYSNNASKKIRAELSQEIHDLTTEYQKVLGLIREHNPHYATLTQVQTIRLEEIQASLEDNNTLLLEYSLGEEASYLWAVSPTSISAFELPNRSMVEALAREVYGLITARQAEAGESYAQYQERVRLADAQYWSRTAALSQILIAPVADLLQSKRLLVVTEGALQYIPFDALPAISRQDGLQSLQMTDSETEVSTPLFLEHEVVNLPSASILAILRREQPQSDVVIRKVAVLADPVFDRSDPRLYNGGNIIGTQASANGEPGNEGRTLRGVNDLSNEFNLPRLSSTRREAQAIMAAVPREHAKLVTDFQACRATVMSQDFSRYLILHFATHGIINSESPELSGVVLSLVSENGESQNGFLRLHDIYNLNLSAQLVVLSACNTGVGQEIKGEGLISLVRGFMYAGSRSVIASLWKVDDEATAELMKQFYISLFNDGLKPAAALRKAKQNIWKQKRWRAPFYWGAFVLQGEYKDNISLGDGNTLPTTALIASAALFAISLGAYITRQFRRKSQLQ